MDGAPGPKVPYSVRLRPVPPSWGETGESWEGMGLGVSFHRQSEAGRGGGHGFG